MAVFAIEYGFQQGREGWRERFHLSAAGLSPAAAGAYKVAEARVGLLSREAALQYLAVHAPDEGASPLHVRPAQISGTGTARPPETGLRVRLTAVDASGKNTYRSFRLLRGLRKDAFTEDAVLGVILSEQTKQAMQSLANAMLAAHFCIQVKDRDQPAALVGQLAPLVASGGDDEGNPLPGALAPDAGYALGVVWAPNPAGPPPNVPLTPGGFARLDRVLWADRNGRVRRLPALRCPVLSTFPGGCGLFNLLPSDGSYAGGGRIRALGWSYPAVARVDVLGIGTRSCGPGSSRGLLSGDLIPTSDEQANAPGAPFRLLPEVQRAAPPPPPATVTLTVAKDLVYYTYNGYNALPDGTKQPVRIAQVVNKPNTWLVTASGTDLSVSQATGIPEDILAGYGAPDSFQFGLVNSVTSAIPKGATLILVGHSLGGMEVQLAVHRLAELGYRFDRVITFGSPLNCVPLGGVTYKRMMCIGDPTPSVPPLGTALFLLGHPEQIKVPVPADKVSVYYCHVVGYYERPEFTDKYDATCEVIAGAPNALELGPITTFPLPR
jgi:hypothetical protein